MPNTYFSTFVILVFRKEVLKKSEMKNGHLYHFLPMGGENISNKAH